MSLQGDRFVLPLEQLLPIASWPRDFFGPPGFFSPLGPGNAESMDLWLEEIYGQVFYSDYQALANEDGLGFHVNLWIKGRLLMSINSFYGFEFALGDLVHEDWICVPATVLLQPELEILLHRLDMGVRLPRDMFQMPVDEAVTFADEPFRVEVPMSGQLRIDDTFDLNFIPESPVSFGPIELLESGFLVTVQNAVVDLSRDQRIQSIVDAGLPDDFKGFFAKKVTVQPPEFLDLSPAPGAIDIGEFPPQLEIFMENLGIGTGGLHGTIGLRQTVSESVPIEDRPAIRALRRLLLRGEPSDDSTEFRGDLAPEEIVSVVGKSADGEWFFVDTSADAEDNRLEIGFGWVKQDQVVQTGDLSLLPVLSADSTDPFEGPLTFPIRNVDFRFEQFYLKFESSVPVDVGIRASVRTPFPFIDDEQLKITLTVDARLRFIARLEQTSPRSPIPDTSRPNTFALVENVIIVRVDGIEFGVARADRSSAWKVHLLFDFSLFFRWSFKKRNAEDGDLLGTSLTGLGYRDGKVAFPDAAKLKLSSGNSEDDTFSRGLKIGALAFSVDSIGVGVDSAGAYFVSLDGGISLSVGFKAKGTAGLRFRWRDEFLGVGFNKVGLLVDSGGLEGELLLQYIDQQTPRDDGSFEYQQGWRGRGRFLMKSPPNVFLNLEAAFGERPVKHVFFAVDVGSTSSGIPAGPIAFYGISGLFGYNFIPDKLPAQRWYEDWYRDKPPALSAVAVSKWRVERDAIAFGLGTTIGTSGDKGFAFSSKVIAVISKPGPLISLSGHGNFLTAIEELQHPERSALSVFIVYDGNARTLEFSAGLRYQQPRAGSDGADEYGAGRLVDTSGMLDAFFDLARSGNWHVHLGERPKPRRIRAELATLFRVDFYLIVDPSLIEAGMSLGWSLRKKWGPLRVELAASIEGVLGVVYEPTQVFGIVRLAGHARISAFGIGAGISVGADLSAGAPHPWFYHVAFTFKLETPWFLPDVKVKAEIGDRDDVDPAIPLALRGAAMTHDLPAPDQPLRLYPDLDPDGDRLFIDPVNENYNEEDAVAEAPLVPLDGKVSIGFGHPFNDRTGIIENPTSRRYKEAFGDEGYFRYDLIRVELWKRQRGSGAGWTLVDERVPGVDRTPLDWSIYDDELNVFAFTELRAKLLLDASGGESVPVGLKLWAKTPFLMWVDSDQEADDTVGHNPDYPCPPGVEPPRQCENYNQFPIGQALAPTHSIGIVIVQSPLGGRVLGPVLVSGRFPVTTVGSRIRVSASERVAEMRIQLGRKHSQLKWTVGRGTDVVFEDHDSSDFIAYENEAGFDWIEFRDAAFDDALASGTQTREVEYRVREVCYTLLETVHNLEVFDDASEQVQSAYPPGFAAAAETLLEPDHEYRLRLDSEVLFSETGYDDDDEWRARRAFTQYTYFKTAGPPGLYPTSSPLRDLTPYVHSTSPADRADPVYRGYDVRVSFRDEAAIRGMYARSVEELRLVISNGSEGLVAGADGRPELLANDWLRDNRIASSYQLALWEQMLEEAPCTSPGDHLGGDVLLGTPTLLEPLQEYRAELVLGSSPYLRRNRFEVGDRAAMLHEDSGDVAAPGNWVVDAGLLVELSGITGTVPGPQVSTTLGSTIVFGELAWRNYRVSARISHETGRVGLVTGFQDADNYYLATVNVGATEVEITRIESGVWTRLALLAPENALPGPEHVMEFRYSGEWLQVVLDDEQLEPVAESTFARGRAGFFVTNAAGASFGDLLVAGIPLYDFRFTTSRYPTFQAHVGSFPGSAASLPTAVALDDVASACADAIAAFPAASDTSEAAELARNDTIAHLRDLLELPDAEPPEHFDVTLVEGADGPIAWLMESPEPLHWRDRTSLGVFRLEIHFDPWPIDPRWLRLSPRAYDLDARRVVENQARFELRAAVARRPVDQARRISDLPRTILSDAARGRKAHVVRQSLLDELRSERTGPLKLATVQSGGRGKSPYVELEVSEDGDLSGIRVELWQDPCDRVGDTVFVFPDGARGRAGEVIRVYDGEPDGNDGSVSVYLAAPGTLRAAEERRRKNGGEVVLFRLLSRRGFLTDILPHWPTWQWKLLPGARLRLVYSADTRTAILFLVDGGGLPATIQPGGYRFNFEFTRDLGAPESTLSYRGKTTPEFASVDITVPFAPPPEPALPRRRRLRVILSEVGFQDLITPGELTVRVTISDSRNAERVIIDLPGGKGGRYSVRRGTVLDVGRELLDDLVDDQGLTIRMEATEHDCGPGDVLPPLVFEHIEHHDSSRHPASKATAGRRPTEYTLRRERGPWSASLRVDTSRIAPSSNLRAIGATRS